jgi:hypothetical protein
MSIGMSREDFEREIEIAIVRSFGWAVIEFEAVLFQKFLLVSGPTSIMTEDMFRRHLRRMESKGFLAPVELHNRKAWKRLVIESDITAEPDLTPEEIREFLEKAKVSDLKTKKTPMAKEGRVSESRALATRLIQTLDGALAKKRKGRIGDPTLIEHVENMRHALADSRADFLKYVKDSLPYPVYVELQKILDDRGEELMLLSLRVIESGHRAYPPP